MKNYITSLTLVFSLSALVLSSCSGRRYDLPRVRVEAEKVKTDKTHPVRQEMIQTEPTATQYLPLENEVPALVSNDKIIPSKEVHKPIVREEEQKEVKKNKAVDLFSFTKKMKEHARILKVQDVQKTAIIGWILGMILLFVGFVIFIALALIFLYIIASFVPYTIFLIIAIILGIAAVLFLILGLADVFTPAA